jgi:putative tryptophan/tyrosine transport system substrate-binding protein
MHFDQLKRREFITLLGGAAAWPLAARAQQTAVPVIGALFSESFIASEFRAGAFRQGLGEIGYVEGRNVAIEYRWADGQYAHLPRLVADLIQRRAAVIVCSGAVNGVLAAKAATTTIPIVFTTGVDPVEAGLVSSLNRPGGNATGVTVLAVELVPKKLELLHEVAPKATIIGALVNPTNAKVAETVSKDLEALARTLGLQLHVLRASSEREIDDAFSTLAQLRADALLIGPFAYFNAKSDQIAALTLRYAMPAIFQYREFAAAGGLMSYGTSIADLYRQVGIYTGRILKGEKPADLPVQQATKVELIINLKTARALGLDMPAAVLARADEVIE